MHIKQNVGRLKLVRGNVNALLYTDISEKCLKQTNVGNFRVTEKVSFKEIQDTAMW